MNPDFELLLQATNITTAELKELTGAINLEYPSDPMMQEIRLVRTLHALAKKRLTFRELMDEMTAELHEDAIRAVRLSSR